MEEVKRCVIQDIKDLKIYKFMVKKLDIGLKKKMINWLSLYKSMVKNGKNFINSFKVNYIICRS